MHITLKKKLGFKNNNYSFLQKFKILLYLLIIIIPFILIIFKYYPEKIHSFISRFYIWETTLKIILSKFKIFIV